MAAWIKMSLGMEVGLGPGDFVLDGDQAPPSSNGGRCPHPPKKFFLAHLYCGQMAACIKMPLGMELGLGPGDFVLDGDPGPPPPPKFSAHICCGQMAAWIKMSLGMELGLGPGDFVLDGDPAPPPNRGAEPPNFRPMFIVTKRLDG